MGERKLYMAEMSVYFYADSDDEAQTLAELIEVDTNHLQDPEVHLDIVERRD